MNKREAELQRCLEKTLKALRTKGKLHARIGVRVSHYYLFTSKQFHEMQGNITRTLRKGELRKKEGK